MLALALSTASPVAHADSTEWAGFTCGFISTHDPTGAIQENPDVQFGEMDGGPWTSFDLLADDGSGLSSNPGAAHITLHCWIQVNNPTPLHPVGFAPAVASSSAHCDFTSDGVAAGVCQISYTATASDNVYLCTEVEMQHGGWHETFAYDEDDDPSNGTQCGLEFSAGG